MKRSEFFLATIVASLVAPLATLFGKKLMAEESDKPKYIGYSIKHLGNGNGQRLVLNSTNKNIANGQVVILRGINHLGIPVVEEVIIPGVSNNFFQSLGF